MRKKLFSNTIIIALLLMALFIEPQKFYFNLGFDEKIGVIANSLLMRAYPEEEFEILEISYLGRNVYNLETGSLTFLIKREKDKTTSCWAYNLYKNTGTGLIERVYH